MAERDNSAAWSRFVNEGLTAYADERPLNVAYDFPKMTKKFGKEYLDMLVASYSCKFLMPDEEFAAIWGGVPMPFLRNKIAPEAMRVYGDENSNPAKIQAWLDNPYEIIKTA